MNLFFMIPLLLLMVCLIMVTCSQDMLKIQLDVIKHKLVIEERRFGWDTHGLPAELEAERFRH